MNLCRGLLSRNFCDAPADVYAKNAPGSGILRINSEFSLIVDFSWDMIFPIGRFGTWMTA